VRFVAVGDVLVDVLSREAPRAGERVHAPVTIRAGGSAANAAVWASALGASAAVVGRVGADPAGDLVERVLVDRGIEASIARDSQLPTGVAVALGTAVVASPGASARLAAEDIHDPLSGDALLVSGFSLLQRDSAAGARAALERFEGLSIAVDLASPRLAADAATDLDETLAGANVVLATADEARAVTGLEPEDAVRALAARFGVACVKLGERVAIAAQGNDVVRARSEPVARRSRFGAGDAFAAALLVALAAGESLDRALDLACETGARAAASEDGWPT
jgi:sugar/nucleoside kinase (ribokinase family)